MTCPNCQFIMVKESLHPYGDPREWFYMCVDTGHSSETFAEIDGHFRCNNNACNIDRVCISI